MDIRTALREGMARLRAAQVPSHTLAAELLLMHTLQHDRTWLYTHPEAPLDATAEENYFRLVSRRAAGEPVQYLTGRQEFWGLEFEVTPAVLIPRPETEHLVEVALDRLGSRGIKINMATGAPSAPLHIAEAGTGSGCLAVALARELPHAEIFATDISAAALEVARRNAARHGVSDRIHFIECDLLSALRPSISSSQGRAFFDLVISNPPYIARGEAASLPREVREHEPELALYGGETGLEIYRRLIGEAGDMLDRDGTLVLELGYNLANGVRAILAGDPRWTCVRVTNDLAGIPRVLVAERV